MKNELKRILYYCQRTSKIDKEYIRRDEDSTEHNMTGKTTKRQRIRQGRIRVEGKGWNRIGEAPFINVSEQYLTKQAISVPWCGLLMLSSQCIISRSSPPGGKWPDFASNLKFCPFAVWGDWVCQYYTRNFSISKIVFPSAKNLTTFSAGRTTLTDLQRSSTQSLMNQQELIIFLRTLKHNLVHYC